MLWPATLEVICSFMVGESVERLLTNASFMVSTSGATLLADYRASHPGDHRSGDGFLAFAADRTDEQLFRQQQPKAAGLDPSLK